MVVVEKVMDENTDGSHYVKANNAQEVKCSEIKELITQTLERSKKHLDKKINLDVNNLEPDRVLN